MADTAHEIKRWDQRVDWTSNELSTRLMVVGMKQEIAELRQALASRPAEVDDEGLPPLPEPEELFEDSRDEYGYLTYGKAYTAEQYRQGQRDAVAADRARREKSSEITELLNNPPYGQPDLYSRLHTALTNEVELAKKFGKLPQWFNAVRGLVDWLESETGAAPSHTTNKEK